MGDSQRPAIPLRRDPTILSLLRSGRLPPSPQHGDLKNLMDTVVTEVSRDRGVIQRVSVLDENQRILSSLFSPVRMVPPEVLQLIFELSVDTNHFQGTESVTSAARLASVCVQWRVVAHATPRIWASFRVDFVPGAFNWSVFRSVERHLQLASDSELDLDLRAPESVVVDHGLLELFAQRASRWRSASFKIDVITSTAREILKTSLNDTPRLTSLHIRGHSEIDTPAIDINWFQHHTPLRELSLLGIFSPWTTSFPYTQLTSIQFMPRQLGCIKTVLDQCPRLLSLNLNVYFPMAPLAVRLTPRVARLQALRIEFHGCIFGVQALLADGLTLPDLKSLTLASDVMRQFRLREHRLEAGTWPQAAVVAMLTRSACKLETLRLEGIPLDTSEALQLLHLVPHALEVSFHECRTGDPARLTPDRLQSCRMDLYANHFVTGELLMALRAGSSAPGTPLLPRLRRFEVKVNIGFAMWEYIAMVRSRWPGTGAPRVLTSGVDRLDSISLICMRHDSPDAPFLDLSSVLELKSEGLSVQCDDLENDKIPTISDILRRALRGLPQDR
ncbi:hypothetical protein B0H11DRAFT_1950892 [Mycena galericulata]|nr:hypothetical protein B0H11DRAFT_1950892 [Mycena galericulata]